MTAGTTLFDMYDLTKCLPGGRAIRYTFACGWVALYPSISNDALFAIDIGIGAATDSGTGNPDSLTVDSLDITETPEPSSLLLLGTGLLGLAVVVFRKAKSSGLVLHS